VIPPGVEVAVYEVTAEPPSEAGAAKLTVALRLPVADAVVDVGALGAVVVGVGVKGAGVIDPNARYPEIFEVDPVNPETIIKDGTPVSPVSETKTTML